MGLFVNFFDVKLVYLRTKSVPAPLLLRTEKICTFADVGKYPAVARAHTPMLVSFNLFSVMAKGLQMRKGKVGNEIYYNIANSNNKDKQGVRIYQPNVKNPKSVAQCIQRMKTAPSVAFYRALAELLDHSWQGIAYGGKSTQHFRKLAMLMKTGYPYVLKGDNTPFPGEYQISSGSLVSPTIQGWDTAEMGLKTNLVVEDYLPFMDGTLGTLGDISAQLLDNNSYLQEGDQLTFIYCLPVAKGNATAAPNLSQGVYYKYCRLILNRESEYAFEDWMRESGFILMANAGSAPHYVSFTGGTRVGNLADGIPCGGAVIVSRPPRNEGGAWQRSLTKFFCTPEYLGIMMGDDAYQAALESYQKETSTLSSDWYLNQGGENTDSTNLGGAYISSGSVNVGGTTFNGAFFNRKGASKLIVGTLSEGSRPVYRFVNSTTVAEKGTFTQTQVESAVGSNYTLFTTAKNYIPDLTIQEAGGDDERP